VIIVSNASPIINLAHLGKLDLLHDLYGDIHIPTAVYEEVVIRGAGLPGSTEVREADWIITETVSATSVLLGLKSKLEAGEAEAIALSLQMGADLLILDERKGRREADTLGINYTGLLGALSDAKRNGLVPAIKPLLDILRNDIGFRVSKALYDHILNANGEGP